MNTEPPEESSAPESTQAQGTEPVDDLAVKAAEIGAVYMLPPHELDSPLTADEITPRFGTPVISKGVNYAAMSREYLRVVHGEESGKPHATPGGEPTLRQLADHEHHAVMEYNFRLLRDHDSQAHKKAGVSRFEKFVEEETGEKHSRSTLVRRMVHIKFALLAAAAGGADSLPSQNQANAIGRLPRNHWVRAWRNIQSGPKGQKIGKAALEEAIALYAQRHKLPMRGTRLDTDKALPEPAPAPDSSVSTPPSERELEQRLLTVLESELPRRLPERVQKRAKKRPLPKSYLAALRTAARKPPSETESENHRQLLLLISENHPELGRRLLSQILADGFKMIAEKLK